MSKIIEKPYSFLEDPKRGRLILMALLILGIIFVSFYYLAYTKLEKVSLNDGQMEVINSPSNQVGQVNNTKPPENSSTTSNTSITEDQMIEKIRKTHLDEIKKVEDFINIRANRTATLEVIRDAIKIKENYYNVLVSNASKISEDRYSEIEAQLILSFAMSEEFIKAFDSKTTIRDLKSIIEKYK